MGQQLRFSLCNGAVTTKVLIMVVSLCCPHVSGSAEYPMPYASCLECCGVWLCSACPVAQIILLSLSSCVLLKGALLVLCSIETQLA